LHLVKSIKLFNKKFDCKKLFKDEEKSILLYNFKSLKMLLFIKSHKKAIFRQFSEFNLIQLQKKSSFQVLRKVDNLYEDYYLNKNDMAVICRHFRVRTEIDYFSNFNLLRKAIEDWKSLNPFLRCKVQKLPVDNGKELANYFVSADDKNLSNVKFLTARYDNLSSLSNEKHDEIMKLLVEKDINYDYDYSKHLLWKLKFYKLENKLYDILFTVNHAISEDRCNINLVLKLLDIIDKMHKNEYVKEKEYQLLPAMYGSYVFKPPSSEIRRDQVISERPSFVKPELAKQESLNSFSTKFTEQDIKNIKLVDVQTNKIYSSLPNLLEISKRNYSKFENIKLDATRIVNKCKEKNCKITSCLNIIGVLALKDLYLKYGNDTEKQRAITYGNVISVRSFIDSDAAKIKENMGLYIMNIMNKLKTEQNSSQSVSHENFWSWVQLDSQYLMRNIQSGKIFQTPHFENDKNLELPFYDLFFTNVGNIEPETSILSHQNITFSIAGGLLNIEDYLLYIVAYSIDNSLFIQLFYNSHYVQDKFVSDFIHNFQNIYKKFLY